MSSGESSAPGHIIGALSNGTLIDAEKAKKIIKNIGSETVSKMSDKEREAFQKYTGTAYVNINATLRGISCLRLFCLSLNSINFFVILIYIDSE